MPVKVPTLRVFVRMIGVSRVPSSSICTSPALLPKPFSTATPAASFSWKRSPWCGRTAVTPVWMSRLSSSTVTWPTVTPATSVIRFLGPVGLLLYRSNPLSLGSPISLLPFLF